MKYLLFTTPYENHQRSTAMRSMDAVKKTFEEQAEAAVVVACITADFPTLEHTVLILPAMQAGGDIVQLADTTGHMTNVYI
jgi:hypothetical protein